LTFIFPGIREEGIQLGVSHFLKKVREEFRGGGPKKGSFFNPGESSPNTPILRGGQKMGKGFLINFKILRILKMSNIPKFPIIRIIF